MSSIVPYALSNLVYVLPQIAILVGCIIYMSRTGGVEGILFLIGKILAILSIVSNTLFMSLNLVNHWAMNTLSSVMLISNGVGFIGAVLFSIGFIMMAVKQTKIKVGTQENKI